MALEMNGYAGPAFMKGGGPTDAGPAGLSSILTSSTTGRICVTLVEE